MKNQLNIRSLIRTCKQIESLGLHQTATVQADINTGAVWWTSYQSETDPDVIALGTYPGSMEAFEVEQHIRFYWNMELAYR